MKKILFLIFILIFLSLPGCGLFTSPNVIIDEEIVTLYVGDSVTLRHTIDNQHLFKVVWESSNEKIVSVNQEGIITALQVGETEISLSVGSVTKTTLVIVKWNYNIIPIVYINTNNVPIISKEIYIAGRFSISSDDDNLNIEEQIISIRGRGNSTWGMPKKPYRVKFDQRISLLGMSEARDYVLLAEYADKSLIRNYLAHKLANSMENFDYTFQTRFVEVYLNNQYQGVYLLTEQVEVDRNRLNIDKSYDVDGGFLIELCFRLFNQNKLLQGKDWFVVAGKPYDITSPSTDSPLFTTEKFDYIYNFVKEVDNSIRLKRYHDLIDVDNFIDFFIVNELFKNVDIGFSSVFSYKDKNGLFKMGPVWDFDLSLGNANYINYNPEGWYGFRQDKNRWFYYLMLDPYFHNKFVERYNQLYENQIADLIDDVYVIGNQIRSAANRNFSRWDILNYYVWPNPPAMVDAKTHSAQIDYVYNFLVNRANWMYQELNK